MAKSKTKTLHDILTETVPERGLTRWAYDAGVSPRELYRLRHGLAVAGPLTVCLLARAAKIPPREMAAACGVAWESIADRVKLLGIC